MNKNKLLVVSLLSTFAGVSAAAAHPGGGKLFAKADKDGDGVVTTAELEAGALAHFAAADTDQDGKVTRDEIEARMVRHKEERFAKRDVNGNGVLEREEIGKLTSERFDALDTDESGTLSQAELAAAHAGKGKRWGKKGGKGLLGDGDGDGVVTKDEALSAARQLGKRLDTDGDGKITRAEADAARASHVRGRHGARPDAG